MIKEIKTFEVKCDDCEHKEIVRTSSHLTTSRGTKPYLLPENWGMSGNARGELSHLCPDCLKKKNR